MHAYPPVLHVYSSDARKYTDEKYARLSRLTEDYRTKYLAACKDIEAKFAEMDMTLLDEDEVMRSVAAAAIDSNKQYMAYILRLKLLEYTRRFQGYLYRFGFEGSQTYIAVADSILTQQNQEVEARIAAIRMGFQVHDLHLEYH